MGCSKCKDKKVIEKTRAELKKEFKSNVDIWATILIIVWFLLGIYGLVSLIKDIKNLL